MLTGLLLEELSLEPLLLKAGSLELLHDELLLELDGEDQELLGDEVEIDDDGEGDGDGDDASEEPDEVPAADDKELAGGCQLDETPLVDDVGGLDDALEVGPAELEKPAQLELLEELLLDSDEDELELLEGELLLERLELLIHG